MNFWWVNHKQTYQQEIDGGYIWSPTQNKDGSFNQTYLHLTQVAAGDIIFSFANTFIKAVGIAEGGYIESMIPKEFGQSASRWDDNGFLVKVRWNILYQPLKPKDFISRIAPLLPKKFSPIQPNGNGNQKCYLANIGETLGNLLMSLLKDENSTTLEAVGTQRDELVENTIEQSISNSRELFETEKLQLINARRGQGIFKLKVLSVEKECRVTGVKDERFLIASHIKPWRASTNAEKLDGNNGLLFSPHVDTLFDRGWISFSDNGDIMIADNHIRKIMRSWRIEIMNVGAFNTQQQEYLNFHRQNIYRAR